MRDFEPSIFSHGEPQSVARRAATRNIDQIRRDVYDSHRHRAYSLAYYMTGHELAAEELLARCFTRVFQSEAMPDGGDVDAALLEELRSAGVLGEMTLRGMPEAGSGLEEGENIRRTDLEEALGELPASERLIFLLSDVEGYRAARIAGLTGRSEGEIRQGLMAARLRLREAIAARRKQRDNAA